MRISTAPLNLQPEMHAVRSMAWKGRCGDRRVRGACGSHLGLRARNEDAWFVSARHNLIAVADGMGSHPGGHIASDLAVRSIYEPIQEAPPTANGERTKAWLAHAIKHANRAVRQRHPRDPDRPMATTLVSMWMVDGWAFFGHVGDSRAYRLRDGLFTPLTLDHNAEGEAIRRGVDPAEVAHIPSHLLSRAVGLDDTVRPDVAMCRLRPGDRYVLCTDGLTEEIDDIDLSEMLGESVCPERVMRDLIEEALLRGSTDNVTVAVVTVA